MKHYLIHATNDGGDSLDLLVAASDPVEAGKLWRAYWTRQKWVEPGERLIITSIAVLPSAPGDTAMAYEWSDLLLPDMEYEP